MSSFFPIKHPTPKKLIAVSNVLAAANERLTDMMLGRVADLQEPDQVEVVECQKKLRLR